MIPTPDRLLLRRAGFIMEHPLDFAWTTMGFGMIRTYLDPEKRYRLNVWTSKLRTAGVSDIHDHPWDFTSWILCGQIRNVRFVDHGDGTEAAPGCVLPFQHVTIETGEGGGPVSPVTRRWLEALPMEVYEPGQGYRQERREIHRTMAMDGTVTLNDRSPATPEHTARIYWPTGDWVNAEPRPATKAEIYTAIEEASYQARLARWSRAS